MTSQNKDDESTSKNKENRRGRSILKDVAKARKKIGNLKVGWNNRDQPIDPNKTKFSSYLGLVAKTMVPITIDDWKTTPQHIKDSVWTDVTLGKLVHDEEGNINDQPPPKYASIISLDEWTEFVSMRTSEEFQRLSDENRVRASGYTLKYRKSRLGCGRWVTDATYVPRHELWMAARLHATGDIMDENVSVSESVTQGEHLPPDQDILLKALKSAEHPGRGRHSIVGVEIVLDGNAPLPVPNEDAGLLLLDDALGAHVAWPIGLIDLKIKQFQQPNEHDKDTIPTKESVASGNEISVQKPVQNTHNKGQYIGQTFIERDQPNTLFLSPYNTGDHWMLVVVNPTTEIVYYLDSLGVNIGQRQQLRRMFDNAIKIYCANKGTKCPTQDNGSDCGYYVLRYMKEILLCSQEGVIPHEVRTSLPTDWRNNSTELIDEVKQEWCRYVLEDYYNQ
ncbi:Ulp1 protease family, C-terminal catalytic domain [Sesbania bispinosa]|nr:Ulp1 protease family, C-terminal catalytic domain [Sesbania bispinosa]